MQKKLLVLILFCAVKLLFAAETISIVASQVPQAQILRFIQPMLLKQGVKLQITEIDGDDAQPNLAVEKGQYDANFFQHRQYFMQYKHDYDVPNLVELVGVHVEPMGVYASPKFKNWAINHDITKLPQGTIIGVPSDMVNQARALRLLETHGILVVNPKVVYPTIDDIQSNPYKLKLMPKPGDDLFGMVTANEVGLAVISSNIMLADGVNPARTAIFMENKNSPYVNIVVVRKNEVKLAKMQKLAKMLHSPIVKKFIQQQYASGSVIPAF